jgi:hypothetical protein
MAEPFNATDPFDATAERLRTLTCEAVLTVIDTDDYRSLSPEKQVEAAICGITTGLIAVAFSCIHPNGRDAITVFIKDYIDQARVQVESIQLAEGPTQ